MSTPIRESDDSIDDSTPLIQPQTSRLKLLDRPYGKIIIGLLFLALLILFGGLTVLYTVKHNSSPIPSVGELHTCAWPSLESKLSLLDVSPIDRSEFLTRQATLAAALKDEGVDFYITEPSPSSLYYFNISASYDLSERPFLAILSSNGSFSYLAPKFELGRIARLDMVYDEKTIIEWREEESPYAVLKREFGNRTTKIMVDEHARFFIASGLQAANFTVLPTSPEIASIRAVKSGPEVYILKGISHFTAEVVRSLQPCIKVGITQETLFDAALSLFSRAGVGRGFWAIILFGEQAANPHGGSKGKTLGSGEFVLIDIGSTLHEYGSDVTRTILPLGEDVSEELLDVWFLVHHAQDIAVEYTREGTRCSEVDAASRKVISDGDYGPYFTHRLGHGLGLEMHEHPYLNGANDEVLKAGSVVTNEPGIYVTDAEAEAIGLSTGFGVRLEDPVVVTSDGGMVLTGRRASSPWDP